MVKINSFEVENVKRVKAVRLEPSATGLTIIGGRNGQGKTSVLDALAWALGGNKMAPTQARREGSVSDPKLHIELSNGIIVERAGKNSTLKVLDPAGKKSGQKLLDSFIDQLALNLPRFLQATPAEKGKTLLQIIGVGDELLKLEQEEATLYSRRTEIGRIADQKKKYAAEMEYHPDLPKEPVSAAELIAKQQEILKHNAENQRLRENASIIEQDLEAAKERLAQAEKDVAILTEKLEIAQKSALDLHDESTEALEKNIAEVDEINRKIRVNLDREKAEIDAEGFSKQYEQLSKDIEALRKAKKSLLDGADLPLPGLSVKDGELLYNGQKWDCMSGAEQLKVATAIVRKLSPECGFVFVDKLEQMDLDTLKEYGTWLEGEGLQVIGTRVSVGDECSIIIEDGYVKGASEEAVSQKETTIEKSSTVAWGSWGDGK